MTKKTSRRRVLQYGLWGALSVSPLGQLLLADRASARNLSGRRVLVLYFSRTGTTETLARQVHSITGGDIARLNPVVSYPSVYSEAADLAKREQEADARPAFEPPSADISMYDTVFLGYPLWWGSIPMFYYTYLEANTLAGKTVAPFCTYGSSGLSRSVDEIRRLCPSAIVADGYGISGTRSDSASQREVSDWLKRIGLVS